MTWMDFKGIMLGEVSQMEKNKYCIIIQEPLKKAPNTQQKGSDLLSPEEGGGRGEIEKGGQKIPTSSHKMRKY